MHCDIGGERSSFVLLAATILCLFLALSTEMCLGSSPGEQQHKSCTRFASPESPGSWEYSFCAQFSVLHSGEEPLKEVWVPERATSLYILPLHEAHSKDEFAGYPGLHTCYGLINNLKNQSYGNYIFREQTTQWKKIVQIAQKQNPLKFLLLVQSFGSILNESILQSETYMVWWTNIESKVFNVSHLFPSFPPVKFIHSI